MKYGKTWQKNSIKARLPDVSAIVAVTAPWKHLIMLRNDASSLWAEVLSPLSSCVLYTLRSYSSCLLLLILAAVCMLSHSSLTELMGIVLSGGSQTRWRWRHIWNGRGWISNSKLSVLGVCYTCILEKLIQSKPYMSRRCRIREYVGEKCLLAKIMYENSFYECGQRLKFSLPTERNDTAQKTLKVIFLSVKFRKCLQFRQHLLLFWQEDLSYFHRHLLQLEKEILKTTYLEKKNREHILLVH